MSDFEGYYEKLWRDEAEAGKVVREQRDAALAEARRWKQAATYIADIYAATAHHDLMLKGTSKARRDHHSDVCRKLLGLLDGTEQVPNLARYRNDDDGHVRERLRGVVKET